MAEVEERYVLILDRDYGWPLPYRVHLWREDWHGKTLVRETFTATKWGAKRWSRKEKRKDSERLTNPKSNRTVYEIRDVRQFGAAYTYHRELDADG